MEDDEGINKKPGNSAENVMVSSDAHAFSKVEEKEPTNSNNTVLSEVNSDKALKSNEEDPMLIGCRGQVNMENDMNLSQDIKNEHQEDSGLRVEKNYIEINSDGSEDDVMVIDSPEQGPICIEGSVDQSYTTSEDSYISSKCRFKISELMSFDINGERNSSNANVFNEFCSSTDVKTATEKSEADTSIIVPSVNLEEEIKVHCEDTDESNLNQMDKPNNSMETVSNNSFLPTLKPDQTKLDLPGKVKSKDLIPSSDDYEPMEEKEKSFLRVHDITFKKNNEIETNNGENVLNGDISNIDKTQDEFKPNCDRLSHPDKPDSVISLADDDEESESEIEKAESVISVVESEDEISNDSQKVLVNIQHSNKPESAVLLRDDEASVPTSLTEEKNNEETEENLNEPKPAIDADEVILVSRECPIVCLDSDSEEEHFEKPESQNEILTKSETNTSNVCHPPPTPVKIVAEVKFDSSLEISKKSTNVIIKKTLDVELNLNKVKREKIEQMKQLWRRKEIERNINNHRFRRLQPTLSNQASELLLNPFAIHGGRRSSSRETDNSKKIKTSPSNSPITSFDLTDDEPIISSASISKNLSKIRESVFAEQRTNPAAKSSKLEKSRFGSPLRKTENPNTISVFDIINDVTDEIRSSRRQRTPSPRRKVNQNERFGDKFARNVRPSSPYFRGGRKRHRSPSPHTEYHMASRRIERNLGINSSKNDVDFRDIQFTVYNDLSHNERELLNMRDLTESNSNVFKRLGESSREYHEMPPSPPRGAFSRKRSSEDFITRDFPVRRGDLSMTDEHRHYSAKNNFPPRTNHNFDDEILRNRFDGDRPHRNDFDGRNNGNMFTVSNPRNIGERSFRMPSPQRIDPPLDSRGRNSRDIARQSVFNRLQSSSRIQASDVSDGYWEQGGVAESTRTPSPPPPPIYKPDEYMLSDNNISNRQYQSNFPQMIRPEFQNVGPSSNMMTHIRPQATASVENYETEDFLIMVASEDETKFLTPQNCSQILDYLEMLSTCQFQSTAYKDEYLFVRTTRSKGEWILKVVRSTNLSNCPKLTGEVCLGSLPSSEPYQVSVKIISGLMNSPLKSTNFVDVLEVIQDLLAQHPRWGRLVNSSTITYYRSTINIDCCKDLDTAKNLKNIISSIRVEHKNCPKLAVFVDGDYVDMTMSFDAQLRKVGTIMNAIRSMYPVMQVSNWIVSSVHFNTGVFHVKVPVNDATLLCKERLVMNIKWHPNCRGRLIFEFIDKRIERKIWTHLRN